MVTVTDTDTVALATAASVAAAFAAVAFVAVGDSYNEPVYQGSAGYTDEEKLVDQSVFRKLGIKLGVRWLYKMNATVHNKRRRFVPQTGRSSVK
jgi:hypothetical protein